MMLFWAITCSIAAAFFMWLAIEMGWPAGFPAILGFATFGALTIDLGIHVAMAWWVRDEAGR